MTGYILDVRYNSSSDPTLYYRKTKKELLDIANKYFKDYDFELRGGKPYDPGHAAFEDDPEGYKCFANVTIMDGKVLEFMHAGGDGPMASIWKAH